MGWGGLNSILVFFGSGDFLVFFMKTKRSFFRLWLNSQNLNNEEVLNCIRRFRCHALHW